MRITFVFLVAAAAPAYAAPPTDAESAAWWKDHLADRAAERAEEESREYPAITRVGVAAPGLLAVTALEGVRVPGAFGPYGERPGDEIGGDSVLTRGGEHVGVVVAEGGPRGPHLWAFDRVKGARLDRAALDDPAAWVVRADGKTLRVVSVSRKSTPRGRARDGSAYQFVIFEHQCFLELDPVPEPGEGLSVSHGRETASGGRSALSWSGDFDPDQLESPSVHANQHGFHPGDAAKRAYLSLWRPVEADGGATDFRDYAGAAGFGLTFSVVPAAGGPAAATGPVVHRKGPGEAEEAEWQLRDAPDAAGKVNSTKTHVFEMDFGPAVWPDPEPGEYRVSVAGLGCSRPFRVDGGVWEDAFRVGMAGLYNHRAGVELDGRYGYARPRSLHPADGFTVYRSRLPIVVTGEGPSGMPVDYRVAVEKYLTDETAPDAWGGLMDAGDWDRRVQHLDVVYELLDLYERFPDYFGRFGLNLPDTAAVLPDPAYGTLRGDADLPDVLAEALFTLDFFRRLQNPDGGVCGGVEEEFRDGRDESAALVATSWTTAETPFLYAPDAWSTWQYAAACAKAAAAFDRAGEPALAAMYEASGRRAWDWAEAHADPAELDPFLDDYLNGGPADRRGDRAKQVESARAKLATVYGEARAWAAAEWWRRTGEAAFGEAMRAASGEFSKDWPAAPAGLLARAFWATAANPAAPADLRTFCLHSLARTATEYGTDAQANMAFRQAKHPFVQYYYGAGVTPAELERAQARVFLASLSGPVAGPVTQLADTTPADRRVGLVDALSFPLGGNPRDLSFVIGLGENPASVLHLDSYHAGVPAPPGVVQYGFHAPKFSDMYWWLYVGGEAWSELWDKAVPSGTPRRAIEPDRKRWPTVESFVDHPFYPMDTEYTVQQGVAGLAYLAGVLAADADGAEPSPLPTRGGGN